MLSIKPLESSYHPLPPLGSEPQKPITDLKNHIRTILNDILSEIECKEIETGGESITVPHSKRVAKIATATAETLSLNVSHQLVELCALAHDIGKLFMDNDIIHSDEKVSPEIRKKKINPHPQQGISILVSYLEKSSLRENLVLKSLRNAVLYHHQKLDGSGYPKMLNGDEMFLSTQIIAIADAFDAILTRAYRERMSFDEAIDKLREELLAKPKQYNSEIVEEVYQTVIENRSIYEAFTEEEEELFGAVAV